MSDCATYGADMNQVPTKHCEVFDDDGEIQNWKHLGYSIILDVLIVIMKHDAYKLRHCNKYVIIF